MKRLAKIKRLIRGVYLVGVLLSGCSADITEQVFAQQFKPMPENLVVSQYHNTPVMLAAQVLYSEKVNLLAGWNHVEKYPNEFTALSFPAEFYQIEKQPALKNSKYPYSTTLIKKYHNWSHQHSNGITAQFPEITYAEIVGIELVIRINSARSSLPNKQQLATTYNPWVSNEQLAVLDDGNVHLSLSLRSQINKNTKTPQFNAEYFLALDAKNQLDGWYHIFIPVAELVRYNELNYHKTSLTAEQAKAMLVADFKISAETKSGQVIRHHIRDSYDENVPALFKEVGLDIKYIAIVKNK